MDFTFIQNLRGLQGLASFWCPKQADSATALIWTKAFENVVYPCSITYFIFLLEAESEVYTQRFKEVYSIRPHLRETTCTTSDWSNHIQISYSIVCRKLSSENAHHLRLQLGLVRICGLLGAHFDSVQSFVTNMTF